MDLERMTRKTGVIIDGNAFLYRTYHVLKHRIDGELTQGLIAYSFISQIKNLLPKLSVFSPVMHIIWDGRGSRETRQDIYEPYKLNRPEPASLIHDTREALKEELGSICGRLALYMDRVEADDLIHLMATDHALHDRLTEWIICTRDEDLMQALDEEGTIKYYNPYTKKLWSYDDFREKYGFAPQSLVLYKALVGDKADNWPGVSGIGDKTAKKWLTHADDIVGQLQYIAAQLKTDAMAETFRQGLALCELPLPGAPIHEWRRYLLDIMGDTVNNDWSSLHERFEINATDKAQFLVGTVDG
jgi:5'-3' exonuclease